MPQRAFFSLLKIFFRFADVRLYRVGINKSFQGALAALYSQNDDEKSNFCAINYFKGKKILYKLTFSSPIRLFMLNNKR